MLNKPSTIKKVVSHARGKGMLTCICMQNVIKIYHVVQELLTDGRNHLVFIAQTQESRNFDRMYRNQSNFMCVSIFNVYDNCKYSMYNISPCVSY